MCHSQPKLWYFIISNASRSINLFLAQWRHISSESAVTSVFSFPSNCVNIWQQNVLAVLMAKRDAQLKAWDILLVLTSVVGNLCNKCPSGYSNKTAVKVILSMRSLVSIEQQSPRRPCDINTSSELLQGVKGAFVYPWQFTNCMGAYETETLQKAVVPLEMKINFKIQAIIRLSCNLSNLQCTLWIFKQCLALKMRVLHGISVVLLLTYSNKALSDRSNLRQQSGIQLKIWLSWNYWEFSFDFYERLALLQQPKLWRIMLNLYFRHRCLPELLNKIFLVFPYRQIVKCRTWSNQWIRSLSTYFFNFGFLSLLDWHLNFIHKKRWLLEELPEE